MAVSCILAAKVYLFGADLELKESSGSGEDPATWDACGDKVSVAQR